MRALLLAAAAGCVAVALGLSDGSLEVRALALVLLAAFLAAGALLVRGGDGHARTSANGLEPLVALALGAGVAAGFAHHWLGQPGWQVTHAGMPAFRPVLAVSALVAATHLWPGAPRALRRFRPAVLALLWFLLVVILFRAGGAPEIDVWDLQQGGAEGLLGGENPYALAYPNRYGPGTRVLAKEVLSPDGEHILAYPYPPLTVLAGLPARLAGDVRWAHVALTLLSAAGIWLLGRRTRVAELAATLVLFQPAGFLLVEQAWTEPLVLACLVGLALALARERWALAGVAAGLALASKQYTPLLLVPFLPLLPSGRRLRAVATALAMALALYLPFALWDPAALWRSLVGFHLAQPFRKDSLSLAAWLFARDGTRLPDWPGFLLAGLAVAALWRRIREPAGALAVAALAWLLFLALGKQAFANYYGLAVGLLAAAAASASAAGDASTRGIPSG